MLILTRRPGQLFTIDLAEDLPRHLTVGELFAQGPIKILVTKVTGAQVKLGITAHPSLCILRWELSCHLHAQAAEARGVAPNRELLKKYAVYNVGHRRRK